MAVQHDPKQAVSRWYMASYEHHAEQEQAFVYEGKYDEAQEHHDAARSCAKALTAEMDDPYPHGLKR